MYLATIKILKINGISKRKSQLENEMFKNA